MSDVRILADGLYAVFDGMCWPLPGEKLKDLEYALRYGELSRSDKLSAASVIAAYIQMVDDPAPKRNHVVRQLRQAAKSQPKEHP